MGQEVYGVSLRLGFQGELNKMSLLSAPGSVFIKTTLMKSPAEALNCGASRTMFLSKQVRTIVAGRQSDAQTIEVLEPIHF